MKAWSVAPAEPALHRVSRVLAWLAGGVILVGGAFLITIDVVTRALMGRGVVESFEISGYALAGATGLALGFTVTGRANIRVDVLTAALPWRLRAACDLFAALALAATAAALAWWCWGTLAQSWAIGARSNSALQTPMAIPQVLWWLGLFWFASVAALIPAQAAWRLLQGDRAGFEALIGAPGVADALRDVSPDGPDAPR